MGLADSYHNSYNFQEGCEGHKKPSPLKSGEGFEMLKKTKCFYMFVADNFIFFVFLLYLELLL